MSEDVRRLSDELARDPGSRVFVPLGEALRQQGQLDVARKVTLRGLERHPHLADAHDLLARILVDHGDMERAFDEWDMVLRLSPGHLGALKGMGFVCFHRERFPEAERYLAAAAVLDPRDDQVASALHHVRAAQAHATSPQVAAAASIESDSRYLFVDVLPDEAQTALLLDPAGLVLAGAYMDADGRDVAQEVGAELSGVTEAARRATRHLAMGDWTSIVFETEVAVVAMAPSKNDGLLVLATSRATPLGLVRRLLDRCSETAQRWLEEQR
jgi:predicted regulator of Ras-like GTPase activity (Roadblock/LC7/MglB family)/predicted Zn-dependent protease